MDTHELAWAAGFFDGEGYVGAGWNGSRSRQKPWPRVRLYIGQTKSAELLERFAAVVGAGRVRGPDYMKNPNWAPVYRYETAERDVVHQICWMLWPWLGTVKRRQFDESFERFHAMRRERVGETA